MPQTITNKYFYQHQSISRIAAFLMSSYRRNRMSVFSKLFKSRGKPAAAWIEEGMVFDVLSESDNDKNGDYC